MIFTFRAFRIDRANLKSALVSSLKTAEAQYENAPDRRAVNDDFVRPTSRIALRVRQSVETSSLLAASRDRRCEHLAPGCHCLLKLGWPKNADDHPSKPVTVSGLLFTASHLWDEHDHCDRPENDHCEWRDRANQDGRVPSHGNDPAGTDHKPAKHSPVPNRNIGRPRDQRIHSHPKHNRQVLPRSHPPPAPAPRSPGGAAQRPPVETPPDHPAEPHSRTRAANSRPQLTTHPPVRISFSWHVQLQVACQLIGAPLLRLMQHQSLGVWPDAK